jgi:hypothetical protein
MRVGACDAASGNVAAQQKNIKTKSRRPDEQKVFYRGN